MSFPASPKTRAASVGGPPAIADIIVDPPQRGDYGYELGVDLGGFQGTWHRLWAICCLDYSFGHDPQAAASDGVLVVRKQFEGKLRRPLSGQEWQALCEHARGHWERNMRPALGKAQAGPDTQGPQEGSP